MNFCQNTCFKERSNVAVEKKLQSTNSYKKRSYLSVITWNEKYSSKQIVAITYTLEKTFSATADFEGL